MAFGIIDHDQGFGGFSNVASHTLPSVGKSKTKASKQNGLRLAMGPIPQALKSPTTTTTTTTTKQLPQNSTPRSNGKNDRNIYDNAPNLNSSPTIYKSKSSPTAKIDFLKHYDDDKPASPQETNNMMIQLDSMGSPVNMGKKMIDDIFGRYDSKSIKSPTTVASSPSLRYNNRNSPNNNNSSNVKAKELADSISKLTTTEGAQGMGLSEMSSSSSSRSFKPGAWSCPST